MSAKYKVAMIGCGKRAKQHVPGLLADDRCEVVALADVKAEAAEAMNEEAGFAARIYTDHRKMLAEVKPDVVIACLWTALHLPVFRDCVEAGVKAVLSEKPMAPTWAECREMGRVAESSGCQLTFCHQRRFAAGNQRVRQLLKEGRFGRVQRMDLYSPPNLLDCGTHTFDQALSFNAETPARWVLGAVDTSDLVNYFGIRAEAMAVGTVVFDNDVRANLQVGGPDKDMSTGVRVIGSEGFIEVAWDGQIGRAAVYNEPDWQPPEIEDDKEQVMVRLVANAIDALESGGEPELDYRKALRATEILFALYESVRRRQRVELPIDLDDNPFLTMLESGEIATPAEA